MKLLSRPFLHTGSLAGDWPRYLAGVPASAGLGVAFFFYCFGSKPLNPRSADWLLARGDPAMSYLGWLFFRHEPWSFPLGRIRDYLAPMGTSICYTDSVPLLAIPLKVLAHWLPDPFQYLGIWMLLSCILQSVFGYLLSSVMLSGRWTRLAATLLFLTSPIMMYRQGGHIALASHWCLLWALWLCLRPVTARGWWGTMRSWLSMMGVTALVHPYLTVMCGAVALAFLSRSWLWDRLLDLRGAVAGVLGLAGEVLGLWWISGYIDLGNGASYQDIGFGYFSLNLNALLNPLDSSRYLGPQPVGPGQYEGYAYLGLGLIVASIVALGALVVHRPKLHDAWRHAPLGIVLVVLMLFALSNDIRLGDRQVFAYKPFWLLTAVGGALRSSGRFAWPAYYFLICGVLWALSSSIAKRALPWVLSAAVLLQVADMSPWYQRRAQLAGLKFDDGLTSPEWARLANRFDRMLTYPPYEVSTQFANDFRSLALWATRNGMATSAGYAARVSNRGREALRARLEQTFETDRPEPRTLYVLNVGAYASFAAAMADSFTCAVVDGYVVAHARSSAHVFGEGGQLRRCDFATFLSENRDRTVALAVKDEATHGLDPQARSYLAEAGAHIDSLRFRGSYLAILSGGRVVAERIGNDHRVELALPVGAEVGGLTLRSPLELMSAGNLFGNDASLRVGGREYCLKSRGINTVVLNAAQDVVAVAAFDTFEGRPGIVLPPPGAPPLP